jgi:hypothetical protein
MKRIYIAHPLVGDGSPEWSDQPRNVNRYLRFCASATEAGHAVLSWVHHWLMHNERLTGLGLTGAALHDYYLTRDEALVDVADELWVAGPVAVSAGMRREVARATERGIPIVHNAAWDDPRFAPLNWRQPPPATGLTVAQLVHEAHGTAVDKGWWESGDRNVGELLALMHSELSEALEEWRNGHGLVETRTVNGKPEGFPIELADVLVRIGDMCGRYGIDLEEAVRIKLVYNRDRPHRHGGKLA